MPKKRKIVEILSPIRPCNRKARGRDRFSSLANDAIVHILSFLPAKEVLRTCVLSTRWLKHWMSVGNLDFAYENNPSVICDDQLKFMTSVTRAIRLTNNSPLQRFSLNFYPLKNTLRSDWIMEAVDSVLSRGIRELDVHALHGYGGNTLPRNLLLCTTLEVLKLGSGFLLEVPSFFCLPKLKILSIRHIRFSDDQSVNRLISSCPVLEDLSICCDLESTNVLHVSAPALKTFRTDGFVAKQVVLDTPHLELLCVASKFVIQLKHPQTLAAAEFGWVSVGIDAWVRLLHQVANVQSIRFSDVPLEVQCSLKWPDFPNLTYLCVGHPRSPEWYSLMYLLRKTPRLETLIFEKGIPNTLVNVTILEIPPCLSLQVKVIVIRNFGGKETEMDIVEYFLSKCKALNKMEIHTRPEVTRKELLDKIKTMKIVGRPCEIVIS